ncbi:MAG: tetratricopeptide repeat protein [Pseudomonadota bacterium]
MQQDLFGQDVTLERREALDHWNRMMLAFLAHGADTPDHLGRTLGADPGFALGHAVKGLFLALLGRRELIDTARDALAAARSARLGRPVTEREAQFVDALGAWLDGRPSDAVAHLERVLAAHPSDALAAKLSHALRFVLGDAQGMRRSIEAVLPSYGPDHPGRGYMLGCHAFALEETGEYARARDAGRQGLELSADDAWGLHAVAHVHDMTGDSRGGLDWLGGREQAWAHCNNFRYHVWWHKALMHLDQGEIDEVLALYDTVIRADRTDDYRDISNATSLLCRLELEGVDVANRWEELADVSERRTDDGCLIFADLHYLLALIGDGRQAAIRSMLVRMQEDARSGGGEMEARMAAPGLAAAAGLEAFGDGDYRTAFLNLSTARRTMQQAGGSHAQRDVFERLTIDAGIRAGFLDEAEGILSSRTARRNGREDSFAAARHTLIEDGRRAARNVGRMPAE